jgi:hypothetical protein
MVRYWPSRLFFVTWIPLLYFPLLLFKKKSFIGESKREQQKTNPDNMLLSPIRDRKCPFCLVWKRMLSFLLVSLTGTERT